jgi:hypothetical protein
MIYSRVHSVYDIYKNTLYSKIYMPLVSTFYLLFLFYLYTICMTTLTLDAHISLPTTHFSTIEDMLTVLSQYRFEGELLSEYAEAKKLSPSAWTSI